MFECKACKAKDAEIEHLRKWIDRLMEQKAPELKPEIMPDDSHKPLDEDTLFDTDAGGFNDRPFRESAEVN